MLGTVIAGKSTYSNLACIALTLFYLNACCDEAKVPRYIRQLQSRDTSVRNDAALALGNCGSPEADKAVPYLARLIYDPNVGVQSSAAYALRKIDTPEARRVLDKATKRK